MFHYPNSNLWPSRFSRAPHSSPIRANCWRPITDRECLFLIALLSQIVCMLYIFATHRVELLKPSHCSTLRHQMYTVEEDISSLTVLSHREPPCCVFLAENGDVMFLCDDDLSISSINLQQLVEPYVDMHASTETLVNFFACGPQILFAIGDGPNLLVAQLPHLTIW